MKNLGMGRKLVLSLTTCLTAAALLACSEDEAEPGNPGSSTASRVNIDPNATKLTNVTVQNVQITPATTGSVRATGRVVNNGTGSISDPDVAIYAVDPAGRPYGDMTAIDLRTTSAGGSWDFQTLTFAGQVQNHVDYVIYDAP